MYQCAINHVYAYIFGQITYHNIQKYRSQITTYYENSVIKPY